MEKYEPYFHIICRNCKSSKVIYWGQRQDVYTGLYHFFSCKSCGQQVCLNTGELQVEGKKTA